MEQLRQCFEQKSAQVRRELEDNQFFRFNQIPRQLPAAEPSCAVSFVDSDAISMCSNKAKSRRRHMEKNTGSDMAHVPPRRAINYHETELATNHPTVFATRLIAKLEKLLLSVENQDQDDFGSKVSFIIGRNQINILSQGRQLANECIVVACEKRKAKNNQN